MGQAGVTESDLGVGAGRAALRVDGCILMVPAGSRAYGLATEGSDEDWRGVFTAPTEDFWKLSRPPETREAKEPDIVAHEVQKFCGLAVKGNPGVLEVLWTEPGYHAPLGLRLKEIRKAFLWKGSLEPYRGYAKSQLWRLHHTGRPQNQGREGADPKFATHLLRILLAGIHLAMTGEVLVDVSKPADPAFGDHREFLMEVRRGKAGGWGLQDVVSRATTYLSSLDVWTGKANLPDGPDVETIEAFLKEARLSCLTR